MANITFYIDKNNADKDGYSPIKANVTIDYKNVTKTIGKVKARHWNKNKQRVSPPRPDEPDNNHTKINSFLQAYKANGEKYFSDCTHQNIQVSPELIRNYFKGDKLNLNTIKKDFWEAYDEFLKAGELEKAHNTNRNRKTIKNKLKLFESETGYKMTFESINLVFYDQMKEYILETKGHGFNYLSAITDKFKAFMNWSFQREYHNNATFHKFSAPEKEGSIIQLTFSELQTLINFPFESKRLQRSRDFYCFGCLSGLRYVDLQRLTKDNISEGMIKLTTQKTNREVSIPILPETQTIIDRYREQYKLLPKFANSGINKNIKEACKLAGINDKTEYKTFEKNITKTVFRPKHELIGTHTARKTFICLAYDNGLDIEMIKSITGITKESTLRRYLKIRIEQKKEKLSKAFEKLSPQPDPEPNTGTIQAIKEALLKKGVNLDDMDELFNQLANSPT